MPLFPPAVPYNASTGNAIISGTLQLTNGATITFGPAADTDLYRLGSNSLATDSKLTIFGDISMQGTNLGFYGTTPLAKPTVTGSKGANAALTSLMTALANLGLVVNSTS